jgi:S1-C subfamily serine protease
MIFRKILAPIFLLAFALNMGLTSSAADPIPAQLEIVFEKCANSLVAVRFVQEYSYMNTSRKNESKTTGLLVGSDGLVMIPGFVVSPPESLTSGMNLSKPSDWKVAFADNKQEEVDADYVGRDVASNMAFIRIREVTLVNNLQPVVFTDADLVLGQQVAVIDLMPRRFTPNRQMYISRIGVAIKKPAEMYGAMGQLSSFIGGPVCTMDGAVVGVVGMESELSMDDNASSRSGYSRMYSGYVIPFKSFKEAMANPPTDSERKQGWLGVLPQALGKDLAEYLGLEDSGGIYISSVIKGSPAEKAGLVAEDVLLAMDGKAIDIRKAERLSIFKKMLLTRQPGETIKFTVFHAGEKQEMEVVLAKTPVKRNDAEKFKSAPFGMQVRELVLDDIIEKNLTEDQKGVVIVQAESGGAAEIAELTSDDLIQKVDSKPVSTIAEFKKVYQDCKENQKEEILVFILRGGTETKFVRLKPDWSETE